jgi:hypothetical protein
MLPAVVRQSATPAAWGVRGITETLTLLATVAAVAASALVLAPAAGRLWEAEGTAMLARPVTLVVLMVAALAVVAALGPAAS